MHNLFEVKKVDDMKFAKRMGTKIMILYFLVLCLGCFAVMIFVRGIKNEKKYNFTYLQNNKIDYKVYLKENNFFEDEYLPSGTSYIASLIDKIAVDFNYDFKSEDKIKSNYEYYINARLEAKEKGKEVVIWSKDETIFGGDLPKSSSEGNFDINTNVNIDYNRYNTIMNEFRNAYGVQVDGNLIITLNVKADIDHEKADDIIPVTSEASLIIPLIEQTVNIEMDTYGEGENSSIFTYGYTSIWKYILIVCGIILFGYYLFLSFCTLKLIYNIIVNQSKYAKKLKYIFNNYDSIIVNVQKLPEFKNKSVIDVLSFNELLDAQSNVSEPILYKNVEDNRKSTFIIVRDSHIFRYNMKYTDFMEDVVTNG